MQRFEQPIAQDHEGVLNVCGFDRIVESSSRAAELSL
jgi:hypothetical protein